MHASGTSCMDFKRRCVEMSEAAILHIGYICHLYSDRELNLT